MELCGLIPRMHGPKEQADLVSLERVLQRITLAEDDAKLSIVLQKLLPKLLPVEMHRGFCIRTFQRLWMTFGRKCR